MNKLVELKYNEQQKNEIIITNFIKMLYNRNYFGDSNLNDLIKSGINNFANYKTFIKFNNLQNTIYDNPKKKYKFREINCV